MNKLIFIAIALVMTAVTACGPSAAEKAEKARQDSIRVADSLNAVAAAIERARLDSLRQDSIEKYQQFVAAIPSFTEIENSRGNWKKLFANRGFSMSSHTVIGWDCDALEDVPYKAVIGTLQMGDRYCQFYKTQNGGFKMTIKGAPTLLEEFANQGRAYVAKQIGCSV